MNRTTFFKALILFFLFNSMGLANLFASSKLNVVATTTTLASIAKAIAGEGIKVSAIASPKQNIHHYAPTPKDILKVKNAGLLIHQGLDLEAWRQPLLDAAGNPKFLGDGNLSVDVSKGVRLIEIPTSLSRAEGDIHIYGNPHYLSDPENIKKAASNIAEGLMTADPDQRDLYQSNLEAFQSRLDAKIKEWDSRMLPFRGTPVVTYHRSWSYLIRRFDFLLAGEIEPKPGIPPTAKHLAEIIRIIKEKKVRLIIRESFEDSQAPKKIAAQTGAKVITLSQTVGDPDSAPDCIALMENNIQTIEGAMKTSGGSHA